MIEAKQADKIKIKCPECNHYIFGTLRNDGSITSNCPNCKSVVYSKERKGKEKLIKIKYNSAT